MFQPCISTGFTALQSWKEWTVGAGVEHPSMLSVMKTHHLSCCAFMHAWKSFRESSMDHLIAGNKKAVPKSPRRPLTPSLHFSPPLFCLSRVSSRTKTPFNHDETWQHMSSSILHLINGNDSSVIHHPGWHFFLFIIIYLFIFPSSRRNELNLASFLIAPAYQPACCLGNINIY